MWIKCAAAGGGEHVARPWPRRTLVRHPGPAQRAPAGQSPQRPVVRFVPSAPSAGWSGDGHPHRRRGRL